MTLFSLHRRLLDETLKAYDAMRNAARSRLNTSDGSIYPRKVRIMKMMRDALLKKYM